MVSESIHAYFHGTTIPIQAMKTNIYHVNLTLLFWSFFV